MPGQHSVLKRSFEDLRQGIILARHVQYCKMIKERTVRYSRLVALWRATYYLRLGQSFLYASSFPDSEI